jgi:hypothetical protein
MNAPHFSPLGAAVLSASGLWWEVETPIYRARLRLPRTLAAGLEGCAVRVDWRAGSLFELKVPRIPARLLALTAAHFAREMLRSGGQIEALAWLTWSGETWDLVIPPQEQCASRVESRPILVEDRVGMVIHSHGRAPAFFSATDDESEQDGFLYGVLGGLDPGDVRKISFKFRAGHGGCFLLLGVGDVFDV